MSRVLLLLLQLAFVVLAQRTWHLLGGPQHFLLQFGFRLPAGVTVIPYIQIFLCKISTSSLESQNPGHFMVDETAETFNNVYRSCSLFDTLPGSGFSGRLLCGVIGDGGFDTLNSVGTALGFNFLPPAGDLATSSNWLSSK